MPASPISTTSRWARAQSCRFITSSYRLLTAPGSPFGDRESVTWAEVGRIPLCLLTPDMQNRRIIDQLLVSAGNRPEPTLGIELDDRAFMRM